MYSLHRRKFIQYAAQTTLGIAGMNGIVSRAYAHTQARTVILGRNDVLLFQGDSITDAARERDPKYYNITNADRLSAYVDYNALGSGYAMLAATQLLFRYPDKQLKILNRGVSGDKVYQIAGRWQKDCLDLKPDVLSILVGVNDFWHTMSNGYKGTADTYRKDLKALLERTKESVPGARFIVGEPFALKGIEAVTDAWYPGFDEYRTIAGDLAREFDAVFIPYQKVFDEALKVAPASYWSFDGVHPSIPGNMLMSTAWLKAVSVKK